MQSGMIGYDQDVMLMNPCIYLSLATYCNVMNVVIQLLLF